MKNCFYLLLFLLSLANAGPTAAQPPKVILAPKAQWIEDVPFDKSAMPAAEQKNSYYYLLLDEQENFIRQEAYTHYVYKILANEGVQQMSDLRFEFDPAYEKLTIHSILIHRDGKVINKLPKEIQTIRREQSMDRFLYDGSLTADINLSDVRVGDIIEYSLTKKGYNPIYEGYINRRLYFNYGFPFEKGYQKLTASVNSPFSFKKVNTTLEPEQKKSGETLTYTWNTARVPALVTDTHEPDWFNPYQYVFISNFRNWGEVAAWASKNYTSSETEKLMVSQEIAPKFKGSTIEEYALEAIRFVQDEVRYLGFESGLNSHKPHPPLQVFNQRFGDCKDKSFLLVSILRARNIEAYPMLLNTTYRDKISEFLPSATAFDHCVVQMKLKDKAVYIDPTINDQGGKAVTSYFPMYGKGLVLSPGVTDLIDIPKSSLPTISEIQTFYLDSVGGPGILNVETKYTGSEADNQRSYFSRKNLETTQKSYLTFYGNVYSNIEKLEDIKIRDSRDSNIFIVNEKYKIPAFWRKSETNENVLYGEFYPLTLEDYFRVSKSSQRTAPYSLPYPLAYYHEIQVTMPEDWSLNDEDVHIENDYYNYGYKVKYHDRHLSISTQYSTKESFIPVKDFPKFVEDHEKMMNNLSYKVTYDQTIVKSQSLKWPGILVSLISIGLGIGLVFWLYSYYDPQPFYPSAWAQPIGGWLILVSLGIVSSPIFILYSFFETPAYVNGAGWLNLLLTKKYVLFIFLLLEHVYNVVYLIFSLLVLLLFFRRRSSVPRLVSILYGVNCVFTILDALLAYQIDPTANVAAKDIARSIITAGIWIPYFNKSNRVRKTFVFTRRDDDGKIGPKQESSIQNTLP